MKLINFHCENIFFEKYFSNYITMYRWLDLIINFHTQKVFFCSHYFIVSNLFQMYWISSHPQIFFFSIIEQKLRKILSCWVIFCVDLDFWKKIFWHLQILKKASLKNDTKVSFETVISIIIKKAGFFKVNSN